MTQTVAILVDAYRELNARKMFWISMIISGLVVSVLLLIGVSEQNNFKIAWWETPIPLLPGMDLAMLLKATFVAVGVNIWLTWAAAILALISTASIFPDFVSSGSIDLLLSKPISRLRLFLMKYASGLLFVALQVGAFSLAAFLIIGTRTGIWIPALFIAVPIVVVFFSYLFCVCTLIGLLTRSTIASLLLTLLFWLLLFGLNTTDGIMMMPRAVNEMYVEKLREKATQVAEPERAETLATQLREAEATSASWKKWHGLVLGIKSVLPKTDDTTKLLERWLIASAELPKPEGNDPQQEMPFLSREVRAAGVRSQEVLERIDAAYRSRSVAWVLGTSLAFEAAILALCAWIFCRQDF